MIDQIKAEIERLIKQTELRRGEASADGARETLYWLKDFIESLEKEQEVDLEKELEDWRHKHFKGKRDGDYSGEYLERESQLNIARHFYKLGKNS